MDTKWEIIYFETTSGKSPIFDFIQSLDVKVQNKIADVLDSLEEFGILLGSPHSKKLAGTPLWELRILGGDNIRIFYVAVVNRRFLILHVFQKKKQKTDSKEIKTAINRLNAYNHTKTNSLKIS